MEHCPSTISTYHHLPLQQKKMSTTAFALLVVALLTMSTLPKTVQSQETSDDGDYSLAASLAFVFDITGSMYDDLRQVIKGAAEILEESRKRREKPLKNYVLVPFHDPVIGPVLVTEDPDKFEEELADLYVQGGGDCPEMSIGAIKRALEVSLPHSFIYVFTDARSKDYYLTHDVLALIQLKQSQVVFVLTGDCGNVTHNGYKAYEEIAATSSGQVFLLKKSQVNQVLKFVQDAVQTRKVNLLAVNEQGAETKVHNLPIDSHLKEITVSISGENPKIRLIDPEGRRKTFKTGLMGLLNLRNVRIVNVKAPTPGTWRLRVSSTGPHTVRVTGLSHADFVVGFSKHPTRNMSSTSLRPIEGIATHVLVNSTGIRYPAGLQQIELVDLRGLSLASFPLYQHPDSPSLYNVSAFVPPKKKFFYVKVTGVDEVGYTMQRITPTAISAIKARKPRVLMPRVTRGFHAKTTVLTCQVDSLVPYTVQWWHNSQQQGYDLIYSDSANVTLEILDSNAQDEGYYSCNVTNSAGYDDAVTFLDVSEPPPAIVPASNVSVLPGETAVLPCEVYSSVAHNVTWQREDSPFWSPYQDPRVDVGEDGSLIIRESSLWDEASYRCVAKNEGGSAEETVHLRLKERPVVTIEPRQQTFVTGAYRNISCTARGHPEPTFSWQREGETIQQSARVNFDPVSGTIELWNLGPGDAGDYKCVASNEAGEDSGLARLTYMEAPRIREIDTQVLVAVGEIAVLKCISDGIPLPNTTWYRSDRMLMSAYNVEVNPLGQLIIQGVQDSDAGEYRCVVQNEAGSDSEEVTLKVGAPPEILQAPENVGIDIESNGSLPCQAIGRPPPKLSWRRIDGKPIDFAGRFRQLPSGSLQITRIHPDDEGVYTCIAQNAFGLADAAAYVTVTGIVRPLIAYTQPFVNAIEGESAELECVVLLGKPAPKLTWLRKGEVLRESSSVYFTEPGRVVISGVKKSDEGDYICLASNIGGNESYAINLDVLVPPRLVINDDGDRQSNFSVIQGRSVFLPCAVEADPIATFTWFKDGRPISLTDVRYYIRTDGALEVFSAELEDAARYKCVASNVAGEVEKNMQLFVEVAPRISGSLEEKQEIIVDESVLLPCDVTGTPTPRVIWNKNFMPFDPDSSNRLQVQGSGLYISRAQIEDKAIYECVASNIAGDASKIITLIVYIPPKLAAGATNVTVLYGLPATLECEAQGDPPPAVLWKKDGVILDVNDPQRGYYTSVQGSLTIESVGLRDGGRYSCAATNPAGVATRQITLSVLGAPQIDGELPESVDVVEFNPIILPCPAQGTPAPRITWFKDGRPLTGAELGIQLLDDGALELKSAEAGDSGDYRCLAENVAGIAEREVTVKVLIPPKLSGLGGLSGNGPDSVSVIIKKNVSLICPVSPDTDPPPTITWFKDRQPIRDSARVFTGNQGLSLTITLAEVDDAGRYHCKAENSAGQVEKPFDLDVQVPPTFDESGMSPFNQSVIAGNPIYINCPIQGKPPPQVTWMKDGVLMSSNVDPNVRTLAEGRRLEIANARVTDRGRYVCVGENIAGRTQRDFVVNVFVAPTVEGPGIAERPEAVETTTVYMNCPASGFPLPKITWFRQEVPIKQNTSKVSLLDQGWTLEIRDTNSSDAARYYCRAENVAGDTEKVFDLKILLRPYINRENLDTDIKVTINTTAVINCPVSGDPQPEVEWFKNGVPLDVTNQPRFEVLGEGRQLRIYNSQLMDIGLYTCAAKSRAGEDTIDYNVKILVPPTIDGINVNVYPKVLVDSSVVIYCPAQGVPTPTISWFKDGLPLEEKPGSVEVRADGTELVLTNAKIEDAGRYECVAVNPAGENSKVYDLDVQMTPTISLDGLDTTHNVIQNRTVTLDCPAEGAPRPTILWFYKGIPLDNEFATGLTISEDGKTLRIASAQLSDAGDYVCIATNEAGDAQLDHILNVLVPPSVDHSAVDPNPRVIKGRTAIINCPVSSVPFPDITWKKAGQELIEDARVQIINNGLQLRIAYAEEADAAQYTCVASNPAGEVKLDFGLLVLVPPSIDESNVVFDRKVSQGRLVQMACPVHGEPAPDVTWLLNGRPVVPSDRLRLLENNRVLEIDDVILTDSARYTCIATNEAGQLERNFDLDVLLRPTIDKESVQTTVVVHRNKTARFRCPASGTPQPNVTWTRHGQPLSSFPHPTVRVLDNGQTLELSDAQLPDAGQYMCRATNAAGTDSLSFDLKVYVLPTINKETPDHLHVTKGRSISMRCTARGTPEPKILWMRDGDLLVLEDDPRLTLLDNGTTLQLRDAEPEDAARYTCHAENEAGYADKYFNLEVYEPAKINSTDSLLNVPIVLNDQAILTCPVSGTPSPTIQWLRKGQTVPSYGMPNIRIQDNGRQLRIISAQLLDFGDYMCVASNEAGEDRLQFRVSIMVPPEIQEGPETVAEVVNSRAMLQCEASGQPTPQVSWTKDGEYFPATGLRHRMLPSGTLELMVVRMEDEGDYTCTASNAAGNATRTVQLHIHIPAKIVGRRESVVKAAQGQDVMLSCEVEGSPPPTIFWLRYRSYIEPNSRLRLMENGSLHILNLRRRDTAVYTCLAENSAGTASKNIRLKVEEPPEIYVGQREFSVLQNRTILLPCQAHGNPRPKISWEKDGQEIPSTRDHRQNYGRIHFITLQTGGLAIPHTRSEDAGTFTCVASNSAGETRMDLVLKVQVPPVIERSERHFVASVGGRAVLPCVTSGNPKPRIRWLRNRRRLDDRDPRYMIGQDGSLTVDNIRPEDTGNYICTAENNVGKDAQSRLLRVQVPPVFVAKPSDKELTINSNFQLTCVARGIPSPAITWKLNGKPLAAPPSVNGVSTLTIRSAMKEDAGQYTCVATNPANEQSVTSSARVIIKVPPSVIVPPGDRAVRIAEKVLLNCTVRGDPPPQIIWTKNGRPVGLNDRIQKLANGSLVIYDLTSSDAGNYKCIAINDAGTSEAQSILTVKTEPKFTIEPVAALVELGESAIFDCAAEGVPAPTMYWWKGTQRLETGGRIAVLANNSLRIVATQQSDVGLYRCFATNSLGKTFVETQLDVLVHGGYSEWTSWGACSASCGRGERVRTRTCDSPAPGNGGRDCVGPSTEYATCTLELCPVHGNWSPWGVWGDCSLTCGGGQRRRFRSCSNPPPSGSGQPCSGQGEETETCNAQGCPVDGRFSDWSDWSKCSKTCGQAVKERYRECIQPSHGGRRCRGDTVEVMDCLLDPCSTVPMKAEGNLIGYINNVDIADGTIDATMTPYDDRVKVVALVENVPAPAANLLQHLISLLTPIYWTTALEIDGAYNGYSLTKGDFMREVHVQFATGEILKMSHYGNGLDQNGVLLFDIIIRGEVPDLGQMKDVHLAPYQEEYIQIGPGTVYAHSSRLFRADGATLPYAWNHTITYHEDMGRMPYLVQLLTTQALDVTIEPDHRAVRFQLEATIAPGEPSNRCPQGFTHDLQEFCRDEDECARESPCSHSCHNSPGGFSCSCPIGFLIKADAKTCQDIDECSTGLVQCGTGMECLNTQGSYRCVSKCSKGFEREAGGDRCVDTNECEASPSICEHACQNLVGSYRCSCLPGFTPGQNGRCTDVNECKRSNSPCSHNCVNIRGSYRCSCPPGYRLLNGRLCRDINECFEGHDCPSDQECVNKEGSYHCVRLCPPGFIRTESGRCQDVDECSTGQHRCYFNQRCINTEGGYRCQCPKGYTSRGLGQPCVDRDECRERRGICQHNCTNIRGGYKCTCPPGYRIGKDGFSCHDIDECLEQNINCGAEKMCFNHRGSYSCIDIPCPPDYARDPTTNFCVLECVSTDIPCPPGAKYADIIEFRTVALPGGQPARQDLIRLSAYNQHDEFLPQTVFTILQNDPKLEFYLRPEGGKGIVYTLAALQDDSTYQITVRARSYDQFSRHIQYQTTFIIYISVSAFPF